MGKTRSLLDSLNGMIIEHDHTKQVLIKKYCSNPNLEKYYRNQIEVFDKKYEKQFRELIESHIKYLETDDPYGRAPLWGAEAKLNLFVKLRQNLESLHGEAFIRKLSRAVTNLQQNNIIDQPRWPSIKLDNVFQLFKTIISNRTAHSDNHPKPEHKSHLK